jgi:predicted transposase/invertase (TIGR01784 family)
MTDKKKAAKHKKQDKKNTPHDALIKKVMENPVAAAEFLDEYLPAKFKAMIDLNTVRVEKESFVEKSLVKQLSDIVLSVQTKEGKKAFVYCLIEAQVNPDHWMALRLWKYTLLLCERHMQDKGKIPLVCPLVIFHGTRKYDAPKNLWQLFTDPVMAKELLTNDYFLVDLQSMSNDDINYDKHLSMILYLLKHIHQRDTLKLIEDIFKHCHKAILIDKQQDYLYTKLMVWYSDSKVPVEQKRQLEQLIIDNLPQEDTENVMKTIAQAYIDEGMVLGKAEGKVEGKVEGKAEAKIAIARNLLRTGLSLDIIAESTGLPKEQIKKL